MENSLQVGILRIYISSSDQFNQSPLYEHIVFQAKKEGIAGATVLKGIMGYGASSIIHSYKFWEITDKVPTVIELVDDINKIRDFYGLIKDTLEKMRYGCLVTLQETIILQYKAGEKKIL